MDYSLIAGSLVTFSLLLLFLESKFRPLSGETGKVFVILYTLGVIFWIILGVIMNQAPLVIISSLQAFFLALYFSTGKYNK